MREVFILMYNCVALYMQRNTHLQGRILIHSFCLKASKQIEQVGSSCEQESLN